HIGCLVLQCMVWNLFCLYTTHQLIKLPSSTGLAMPVQPGLVSPTPIQQSPLTESFITGLHQQSMVCSWQKAISLCHLFNCQFLAAGLLPPQSNHQHNLCPRTYNCQFSNKAQTLNGKHFLIRMLYSESIIYADDADVAGNSV